MPARKRIDPKSVPTDGYRQAERVLNQDPNYHYVWVNPNDEDCGVASYLADGYEFVRKGDQEQVPRGHVKEDEVWTFKGQKLMRCLAAERDERVSAGQDGVDAIERRMLRDGNIEDGLRGRGYRLGVDSSRTSGPFVETDQGA